MIIDALTEFADRADLKGLDAAPKTLGKEIALQTPGLDLGQGNPLWLVVASGSGLNAAAADAVVVFTLESSTDGKTWTPHFSSGPLEVKTLKDGGPVVRTTLPAGVYGSSLRLAAHCPKGRIDAGEVSAFLTLDPTGWKPYPEGAKS